MSISSDTNLLRWLQETSSDKAGYFEALSPIYLMFGDNNNNSLEEFKADDRYYCFLIFKSNSDGTGTTATVLHHLSLCPSRIDHSTPNEGNFFAATGP